MFQTITDLIVISLYHAVTRIGQIFDGIGLNFASVFLGLVVVTALYKFVLSPFFNGINLRG